MTHDRIRTRSFRRPRPGEPGYPDSAHSTGDYAGEGLVNEHNLPGIIMLAIAVIAVALTITAAGYGFAGWAVVAATAAVATGATGIAWLLCEHRRIRNREDIHLPDRRGRRGFEHTANSPPRHCH
ncbi:MAG: hypothetical protein J2P18_21470 [Nocardia sp.]|nr:hypothetical protein [Nocardia sp.]